MNTREVAEKAADRIGPPAAGRAGRAGDDFCTRQRQQACQYLSPDPDSPTRRVVVYGTDEEMLDQGKTVAHNAFPEADVHAVKLKLGARNCWGLLSGFTDFPPEIRAGGIDLLVGATRRRHLLMHLLISRRLRPSRALVTEPCGSYYCLYVPHPIRCLVTYSWRRLKDNLLRWLEVAVAIPTRLLLQIRCLLRCRKGQSSEGILVVISGGIGDVVMCTASLRALRTSFPGAHIACVVPEPGAELLELCPHLDELHTYNPALRAWHQVSLAARLARRDLTTSVFLGYALILGPTLIPYMAGARHRCGPAPFYSRHWPRIGKPFTHMVPLTAATLREWFLDQAKATGLRGSDDVTMACYVRPAAKEAVARLIGGDDSRRLVLIHPGCGESRASRRWPARHYAELIDRVQPRLNARIFLTGTQPEGELLNEIAGDCHAPVEVLADKLSVGEMAALIERCDLVITNDTGPLHISLALQTPVVAVFGPTNPDAVVAPRDKLEPCRLLRAPAICPPRSECSVHAEADDGQTVFGRLCLLPTAVCADAVSVGDVLAAIDDLGIAPAEE